MLETISPVAVVIDVATGLIAVTLLWSGLAKIRSAQLTLKAMRGLGAPAFLQHRWTAQLVPVCETAIGLTLLCVPGTPRFIAAVASALMFAVFTFYVARAVARGVEVACECFGSASHAPVDRLTVARNVLLLLGAVLATAAGVNAPSLVLSLDLARIVTFVLAVLIVGAVGLMVGQHRHINRLRTVINQSADRYRRSTDEPLTGSPIPDVELVSADGLTKTLAHLGNGRPVLLIFAKAGCGDCVRVARALPGWVSELRDVVAPIIATSSDPTKLFDEYPEFIGRTYFGASAARGALGIRSLPTAVLLATNTGTVATEVVEGSSAISELVAAVQEQVEQAGAAPEATSDRRSSPAG